MQRNKHHPLPLSLALQGGGAHGAFTWGVLDQLLQAPALKIDAISATSSGAMNACALAQGWARGGAEGARAELERFWLMLAGWNAVPGWWAATTRTFYESAPWELGKIPQPAFNAMRPLVEEFFDFTLLRRGPIRLYLAATRVRDGRLTVFDRRRLGPDALLASACLPVLFPPVEIAGESYWDGGFVGNPTLQPLLRVAGSADLLAVLLQPCDRGPPPSRARDIAERAAQLSFNAAFAGELDALAHTRRRLHGRFWLSAEERRLKELRLHLITPEAELVRRTGNSALDTRLRNLRALHEQGTLAAETWCRIHGADLGRRASLVLEARKGVAA